MSQKISVVFLGTPDFAKKHLSALYQDENFKLSGVISQPDRKSGRKMKLTPSPVKAFALENNIPVMTPESVNSKESLEQIHNWAPDVLIVVAYGQLIGDKLLKVYHQRIVNVHGSLLPKWRGAAPIQRALMNGDSETGVSLQVMVKKLDAGAVIGERKLILKDEDDALSVYEKLQNLGVELLNYELVQFLKGEITPQEQDEALVTIAPKILKSESQIDWQKSAREVFNQIRGLKMGPGSFSTLDGKKIKFHQAFPIEEDQKLKKMVSDKFGEVIEVGPDYFLVQCGQGVLKILKLQPESKQKISTEDFLKGYDLNKGDRFV